VADAEAERLYGLPLDEFTAARDARARELRQDGDRQRAAEVAALRKPVLAAWVVNMLARDERGDIRELVAAAKGIKAGEGEADAAFREALERLTDAGRRLLEAEGRSTDATLHQVAGTLRAAAASDPRRPRREHVMAVSILVRMIPPPRTTPRHPRAERWWRQRAVWR